MTKSAAYTAAAAEQISYLVIYVYGQAFKLKQAEDESPKKSAMTDTISSMLSWM
jgi:hypothetical protein